MTMKNEDYWVSVWARLRQDEVIPLPHDYKIHTDFVVLADKNEIQDVFLQIHSLYKSIYSDIAEQPDSFGMPLHLKDSYRIFSSEWRDSGQAPYQPFILLYNLFTCGVIENETVKVSIEKYKNIKPPPKHLSGISQKILKSQYLFKRLTDYGFIFEGLLKNKPANSDIIVSHPDNAILLRLFKMLADKANYTNRLGDFLCCHFRLLQDGINAVNYGLGADDVADRVHTEAEKTFAYQMDETLMAAGMFRKAYGGVDCHGLAYYHTQKDMDTKKPYTFRMVTRSFDIENNVNEVEKMQLAIRIRSVVNCLAYLEACPESVKSHFRYGDSGCEKRPCKFGVEYDFEGQTYWRCGCCHSNFVFKPVAADIPHYIKLVELGEKKSML